mgnify:CR=1 FL=1
MTNVGNSVFSKILLASLLVFAGLFAILDYGINELFYANQLESKKAELELESLLLVTSASIDNNQIIIPEELEETRFDALNTGLYGYISNADQQLLWQSYSSQSIAIAPENLKPENTSITSFYYRLGYFVFIHTVTWELEEDKPQEIYFVVVENASPTILARDNFQKKIRYRLIISAIVFFAALLVILRLGSQPLFKLTHEIKEIEEKIVGRELECAVLGNDKPKASIPGEVVPKNNFYSFENKYLDENGAALHIPAKLTSSEIEAIQSLALKTYSLLECTGMARVDMFMQENGDLVINEINTIPGFTDISMYPKLWEATGLAQKELISTLIDLAVEAHTKQNALLLI